VLIISFSFVLKLNDIAKIGALFRLT